MTYISQHLRHDGQIEANLTTYEGENFFVLNITVRDGEGRKVAEFHLFADTVEQFGNLARNAFAVAN